jgi:MerR family redox-sensitive transcriptional activator SoxR
MAYPGAGQMAVLKISEIARRVGLRASAIRYYEQIGLLPSAQRIGGQRRYDVSVLYRLAIIHRARHTGFTLDEIRHLFFGFRNNISASKRWQKLTRKKLTELQTLVDQIKEMQRLLQKLERNCHCTTLDECGKGMLRKLPSNAPLPLHSSTELINLRKD